MLFDFNQKPSFNKERYDFCIAGSGPAGITLALKLAEAGYHVALLEGGGLEYNDESRKIYDAKTVGLEAWINIARLRYFGGTSNHWAGRCRPFDRSDFEKVTLNGLPGWPIPYDDFLSIKSKRCTFWISKRTSPVLMMI